MPAKFGAGQLIELVAFDKREMVDDGYGNSVAGDWAEQFQHRAKFIHLRASETVMAGRLESHGSIIMQVRVCAETEQIGTDWQARDVRRGIAYNIRDVRGQEPGDLRPARRERRGGLRRRPSRCCCVASGRTGKSGRIGAVQATFLQRLEKARPPPPIVRTL